MLLIGLCASAVATQGLERFLETSKPLADAAFIVVMQHREALEKSKFFDRVRVSSDFSLQEISQGQKPEPGNIYLAPADVTLTLRGGHFEISAVHQQPGHRGSIDSFLVSLAQEFENHAVGIIFSDTGGDGTLGVAALKEHGGLTIAEKSASSERDEMSSGHIGKNAAEIADFVLPSEEMVAKILGNQRVIERVRTAQNFEDLVAQYNPQLTRIATVLRNRTGHDFHGYKRNTFLRRVQRRIQVTQTDSVDAYLEFLHTNPDEAQQLFNDLLIGVTHFFRDRKEFDFLEKEIIRNLFKGKGTSDQVRIWVLGCATGEEAYSIAILLREQMASLDNVPHIQIFATDIDGRALAQARVGRYADSAMREVSPERLARWFVKEGETYSVVKELREMCIFSQHNIIKDAPFSRLDMISCRNLLIYLNSELQDRVIPLFHFALKPGGVLFLGNSENVTRHTRLFAPIDRRYRVFRQLETHMRVLPEFPLTTTADRRLVDNRSTPRQPAGVALLSKQAERLLERYSPAYMIIDTNHEVLHFSGQTGRFIDPPTGVASLNLLNLIHRDLRMDLRAALHKAETEKSPVQVRGLKVGQNGHTMVVTLTVEPIEPAQGHPLRYAVILQDGYSTADAGDGDTAVVTSVSDVNDTHVNRLEAELQFTRDRLQATIEELESTNEELKASNEEYQSVNEELQSSNEELETSKEELQSLNEELQTVNGELGHRVEELGRANSDLKNLLESTQIATVFLDNDLRIKGFTPAITDLFHLIESDLGRPMGHIGARISYDDLENDVRKVLRTLSIIERETKNVQTGSRYLARVLPYRSVDNVIEGVVLTFLDMTPLVRAEERVRESEARLRSVVEGISQSVWRAKEDAMWSWSSPQWADFTGQSEAAAKGRGWLEAVHPDDRKRVLEAWTHAVESGSLEVEHRLWNKAKNGYRNVQMRARQVEDSASETVEWLGTVTDIHEILHMQERQQVLLAELQHRVRNTLAVVRSIARRSAETSKSVEEYASHLEGRISALARAQSALTRSPDSAIDLQNLLLDELAAQGTRPAGNVVLDGPDVTLAGKAAETLSLAFHELATNSLKYGALSSSDGRIEVKWTIQPDIESSQLNIHWREKNGANHNSKPHRRGFGSELIERMVPYELGGNAALRVDGGDTTCSISIPLSREIRVAPIKGNGEDNLHN